MVGQAARRDALAGGAHTTLRGPDVPAREEPRGDGRPVVLVPGFAGGDWTLQHLAFWLRRSGYDPVRCNFIVNAGCAAKALARVERRVIECSERSGRRVAVLGHSVGGYLARAAAARMPDRVSHAVALGRGSRARSTSRHPRSRASRSPAPCAGTTAA